MTTSEKQLKANKKNTQKRIQRLRAGDSVPAPLEVDLDVNTTQNAQ